MKKSIRRGVLPLLIQYTKNGGKCQACRPLSFVWGDAAAVARHCLARRGALLTPNALMLQYARCHPDFAALLSCATLVPDGVGCVWALRAAGAHATRLPGVELGRQLAAEAARQGVSLCLYGGRPGVAAAAATRLQRDFPRLTVADTCHGYGLQQAALRRVAASGAGLVFLCLGSPAQERAAQRLLAIAPDLTVACLGGSLDIYAGRLRRAPRVFQSMGCEWLYRMLRQPGRLQKLPQIAIFAASTLRQWAKKPKNTSFDCLEKKKMTKMTKM